MIDPKKAIDVILKLQERNPQLYLCGSSALMFSGLLEERHMSDIDFVINRRDLNALVGLLNVRTDAYSGIEIHDDYTSYHGSFNIYSLGMLRTISYKINLLVFKDDIVLNTETITHLGNTFKTQKLDDILFWKRKYNRSKDIKDLDNIANKLIEDILVQ